MSAKKKPKAESAGGENEVYPTPGWCVRYGRV